MKLTKRMIDVLSRANLQRGEINEVLMSTMHGLESRGLVTSEWRRGAGGIVKTTTGGSFPTFSRVRLTEAGIQAAMNLQRA